MILNPLVPGPVSDVKVTASSFTTITLQWMPPLQPNGIIIKYTVQCLGVVTYTNRLSITLSGLYPASAYNISVAASTSKGPGPQSLILANTTATCECSIFACPVCTDLVVSQPLSM